MSDELNDGALRLAVAQICQSMGWDALHKSTHDLLTDVLQRYMQEIATCAYQYSQLYCHTEPNVDDLELAFNDTGVLVHELEDFVTQVDQVPFSYQLPRFPMPKPNLLHHPHKEDIVDRPAFYHEHLPPLIKALQPNEDEGERDAAEPQGLEQSSDPSKAFLRSEIKTIGQKTENQLTENGTDKRTANSSVEFETEAKRRRLESPFNKQDKENKLDILQVLQEKNSQSQSPSPSPDFIPIDTDDKRNENPVFTFTSTPTTSSPKTSAKKKATKKTENSSKDKPIFGSPESLDKKRSQETSRVTNSPKKASAKSKPKANPSTSPTKGKNASPKKTPTKVSPKKKPKPQEASPKSAVRTSKELAPSSDKKLKPLEKEGTPFSPPLPPLVLPHKEGANEDNIAAQPMPKLIIKPLKHEKSQLSGYSVSEIPLETTPLGSVKKKGVKRKGLTSEQDTLRENEPKPKKKKKKKIVPGMMEDSALVTQPQGSLPAALVDSMEKLSEVQGAKIVVDTIKKKKKKHKEKDREKSKQKKVKESSSEFSISSTSVTPIPTIKLKIENSSSTSTISTDVQSKISEMGASKKAHSLPFQSVPSQPLNPQSLPQTIPQESLGDTLPTSSAATGQLLPKPKEDVPRTVITETLSTTVQIYYCPACGLADDGSFMIGCDSCDSWYHGACVGIKDDPGGDWYCEVCTAKKAKKKKKKKSKDKDKHN